MKTPQDADRARAERRRELELTDVKKLLDTPEGLRFLWRVLDLAGIYRTTFTGNSHTFFNEGRRALGLEIKADLLEVDPEHEGRMAKEYTDWLYKNDLVPRGGRRNE
jgi:hypothetical protein